MHMVFVRASELFIHDQSRITIVIRYAKPQGAQALICVSVVCFSVYLF